MAKEVTAISGRDVRLEMEVCSDPVPSRTTWDMGTLRVEAGEDARGRFLAEQMVEHPEREDCYIARLLVRKVGPEDSRRYFLDVENAHGTDRYAVALTVKGEYALLELLCWWSTSSLHHGLKAMLKDGGKHQRIRLIVSILSMH